MIIISKFKYKNILPIIRYIDNMCFNEYEIYDDDYLLNLIKLCSIYIAIDNIKNTIIGYMIIENKENINYLHSIAILPKYQNQKIGTCLLNYIPHNSILLCVKRTNFIAQKLYINCGFIKKSIIKNYYLISNNEYEDAIIMSKNI